MLDPVVSAQFVAAASAASKPSQRGSVIQSWAESTGLSRGTLYRVLRSAGVTPTKPPTGGRPRETSCTTEQLQDIVARVIVPAIRQNKKIVGSYRRYIELAESAEIITPGSLSESQLKYHLDGLGLLRRDLRRPRPTTRRSSAHINQMHQIDWSWCLMTHFGDKGRPMQFLDWQTASDPSKLYHMAVERSRDKIYTIWRMGLVDHYSGAFLVKYYQIAGENVASTLDFLLWAWFPKRESGLIPFGIPEILLCDKGPGNTSHILKNLCRTYDVSLRTHARHHPEAKGSVETFHNFVGDFELEFKHDPPRNIDDLNARAVDWMIRYQTTRNHSRYGMPRFQFYKQHARAEYMRVPPDERQFRDAANSQPEERLAAIDGTIQFRINAKSHFRLYQLPSEWKHIWGRAKVKVYQNPFKAPAVVVEYDGERRLAYPIKVDAAGFREDAKSVNTGVQAAADAPELMRRQAEALGPVQVHVQPMTAQQRRRVAAQFDTPAPSLARPVRAVIEIKYDRLEARAEIMRRIPDLTVAEKMSLLDELDRPSYTHSELDAIVHHYRKSATG
jgi:hypothetical protein